MGERIGSLVKKRKENVFIFSIIISPAKCGSPTIHETRKFLRSDSTTEMLGSSSCPSHGTALKALPSPQGKPISCRLSGIKHD